QACVYHYFPMRGGIIHVGPAAPALAVLVLGILHDPYRMVNYLLIPMQLWVVGVLALVFEFFFFLQRVPWPAALTMHAGTVGFAAFYYQLNWRFFALRGSEQFGRRSAARRQLAPVLVAKPSEIQEEIIPEPASHHSQGQLDEQLEAKMDSI